MIYKNEDRKCECWKCELEDRCNFKDKYQRLPRREVRGALGLCPKLEENQELNRTFKAQHMDLLMDAVKGLELTDEEMKSLEWLSGYEAQTVANIAIIITKAKVHRWKQ